MTPIRPALLFVALSALVACGGRSGPQPAAVRSPAPVDAERARVVALLRARLEPPTPRQRLRLPDAAAIALTPAGPGRWGFRTRCHAYVPASSLPWVYEVAGAVDLPARTVRLHRLAALPASAIFPPFEPGPALGPIHERAQASP